MFEIQCLLSPIFNIDFSQSAKKKFKVQNETQPTISNLPFQTTMLRPHMITSDQ